VKKLISILFLLIFWISTIGYFHIFKLIQADIRHGIKCRLEQGIPENDLIKVSFTGKEKPDWVREGREFRVEGKIYDVVKSDAEEGKTTYYCLYDKKESRLVARMEKLLRESAGDDKSTTSDTSRILISLFPSLFFQDNQTLNHPSSSFDQLYSFYFKKISFGYPPTLIIPPNPVPATDSI
jgi:hypothetical protein